MENKTEEKINRLNTKKEENLQLNTNKTLLNSRNIFTKNFIDNTNFNDNNQILIRNTNFNDNNQILIRNTNFNDNNQNLVKNKTSRNDILKNEKIEVENSSSTYSRINSITKIDPKKNYFPFCIVWTPIPILTYVIPNIGHSGIATSKGIIHDFPGSYTIGKGDFAFGEPTKFMQLFLSNDEKKLYDFAIEKGDKKFIGEEHKLFSNNCHSHVAYILNEFNYKGRNDYNMVSVWWMLIKEGKYVSFCGFVKTYCGFGILILVIVAIILLIVFLT